MAARDHLRYEQMALFNVPKPDPVDVSEWARKDNGEPYIMDRAWHSSDDEHMPQEDPSRDEYNEEFGSGLGFHAGTAWSAAMRDESWGGDRHFHPLHVGGEWGGEFDDQETNWSPSITDMIRDGKYISYTNINEDLGSESIRAPRSVLQTWREHVLRNPGEHEPAEIRAASHGYDLAYHLEGRGGGRPKGLTASPIEIYPSTDEERENRVESWHDDPSSKNAELVKQGAIDIPGMTMKTLYPRFVKVPQPVYPPASEAIELPGFEKR